MEVIKFICKEFWVAVFRKQVVCCVNTMLACHEPTIYQPVLLHLFDVTMYKQLSGWLAGVPNNVPLPHMHTALSLIIL